MNRLVKYLSVVVKWRRLIFWNSLILTALAVGVSFILPQRYTATAQLLPPSEDSDVYGLSGVLGGGVTSRLGRLRAGMLGGSNSSDITLGILGSRTVVQKVAERCSVDAYYGIKAGRTEDAARQLRDMTKLSSGDDGIVRIDVEAKNRHLAANIANTYVSELDSFLRESNISRGHNMRVFIEHRLAQVESSLALTRDSLRAFQQRNRVVAVDDETKAAIEAYAKMQSDLSLREAEMVGARSAATESNPYLANLEMEAAGFRGALRKLEDGGADPGFGAGFGVSFRNLPAVTAEFARRYQDLRVQEESYASLYEQYEYARVLEARDAPALTVLDYAVPPLRRSFPRRARIILAVLLFSFVAGILYAFIGEYFGYIRIERPDEYDGWRHLGRDLTSLVRRKSGQTGRESHPAG